MPEGASLTQTVWNLKEADKTIRNRLTSTLDVTPITAQLLVNRQITDPEKASTFINPSMHDLLDPSTFSSMEVAVSRIRSALRGDENILVFGDYDVDGITATSTLLNFFSLIDRQVEAYVPDRLEEGFGLNIDTVKRLLKQHDPDLVITVDCGTSNLDEISYLKKQDVDTVVLDHHEPPPELPPATAILNPKCGGSGYPFSGLCASGVAFKLAWGIAKNLSDQKKVEPEFRDFLVDSMGMAALGTIADQVPLVSENRIFASYGLSSLSKTSIPGLQALLDQMGISGDDVDTGDVGYKIAPPLNAAGRLQESQLGLELFQARSRDEAKEITETLEEINNERRTLQRNVVKDAEEKIDQLNLDDEPVIVLADDDWHPGVIGIAASRIVDRYSRPCVLIGTGLEPARGSARAPDGFELHSAFEACTDLLVKHGGHANAAGLSIHEEHIDAFRDELKDRASSLDVFDSGGGVQQNIDIDLEIFLPNLDWRLLQEIQKLEPHGLGNPQPVFASVGLEVSEPPELMGDSGDHLSFRVTQGGVERRVVGFGMGNEISTLDQISSDQLALAYKPVVNEWRGRRSIELHLVDIQDRDNLQLSESTA
jgi:single-stranded-DNA-specific exonuclease